MNEDLVFEIKEGPKEEPKIDAVHWLKFPLLFMYVNCIVISSSLALCFSATSSSIAQAYGTSIQ